MKRKIRLITTFVFVASVFALIWINTGAHKESGYTRCDGSGFIPKSSLIPTPGGICIGTPVLEGSVSGHYENKDTLNNIFSTIVVFSAIVYLLSKGKKSS